MDEKEIMKRARTGDLAAVKWILERYAGLFEAIVLSTVLDPELAKTAVRVAMVKAGEELRRVKESADLASWLAGVARRESERFARQHDIRPIHEKIAAQELSDAIRAAGAPERVDPKELSALVINCMVSLPRAKRELLLLRYIYTDSYSEMGRIYGWDRYEVDERLAEARRIFWAMLEPFGLDESSAALRPAPPAERKEEKKEPPKEKKEPAKEKKEPVKDKKEPAGEKKEPKQSAPEPKTEKPAPSGEKAEEKPKPPEKK